jgi:hypothetical protein
MHRRVVRVPAFTPLAELMVHPAWRNLDAIPVVDGSGVLVGVLQHRVLRRLDSTDNKKTNALGGGMAVALGTAYCDLLARALVSVTTARSSSESLAGDDA